LRWAQVDRGADALDDRLPIRHTGALQQLVDPARRDAWRVFVGDPCGLADSLGQGPEGDAVAVREAASPDQPGLALRLGRELADQPRLADAGVPHDRDEPG